MFFMITPDSNETTGAWEWFDKDYIQLNDGMRHIDTDHKSQRSQMWSSPYPT